MPHRYDPAGRQVDSPQAGGRQTAHSDRLPMGGRVRGRRGTVFVMSLRRYPPTAFGVEPICGFSHPGTVNKPQVRRACQRGAVPSHTVDALSGYTPEVPKAIAMTDRHLLHGSFGGRSTAALPQQCQSALLGPEQQATPAVGRGAGNTALS